MSDEWISVGSTFTVTCDTTPLVNLEDYSGYRIYYRRPDGVQGYLTPSATTASTMTGTVSTTLNPLTNASGPEKWRNGFPGNWEFKPYVVGSGGAIFRGKPAIHVIKADWRTQQ